MKQIDFAYRTLYAELVQRCQDDRFISDFSTNGRFVPVTKDDRVYWYFDAPGMSGSKTRKYVGPDADPEIRGRVEQFNELKSDAKARRSYVRTLVNEAGLSSPDRLTGDIVQAMAEAGFFRMRGVLIGATAFSCYSGYLGTVLPQASMQTSDTDFAQFHSISSNIGDKMVPVGNILRTVDPSFREIMNQMDGRKHTKYANATGYMVEFLTPNRGSDDHQGKAAQMPSMPDTFAQPLRYLDFLIYQPVRAVMLHRSGVPVLIPSPERFAIHKLIVATKRKGDANGHAKREKDLHQSRLLIRALIETGQSEELADAYTEAWERGDAWREALSKGTSQLAQDEEFRAVSSQFASSLNLKGSIGPV